MSSHRLTPFELTATRKFVRDEKKKNQRLLLASLSTERTVDLLDEIEANAGEIEPIASNAGAKTIRPAALKRDGNFLHLAMSMDVSGEREVIYQEGAPLPILKDRQDVARLFALASVYRPDDADSGIVLFHSPWGRGGTRANLRAMLQRCLDVDKSTKAKLALAPMVPAKSVERLLRQAEATRIVYQKSKGIRSSFNNQQKSAPAEMALVVKGSSSKGYRDSLRAAIRDVNDRRQFFTVQTRDDDGTYTEEEFDDVAIDLVTDAGVKRYSLAEDRLPTVSFDLTADINKIYFSLPEDKPDEWGSRLLDGVHQQLRRLIEGVHRDAS